MRSQPHPVGVKLQQTGIANLEQRGHRIVEHGIAKLISQTAQVNALVQTQPKEERLLKGLVAPNDIELGTRRCSRQIRADGTESQRRCRGTRPDRWCWQTARHLRRSRNIE